MFLKEVIVLYCRHVRVGLLKLWIIGLVFGAFLGLA